MTSVAFNRASEIAAEALLSKGATNLEAKLGALFATFANCWLTDRQSAACVKRSDGRRYHRGSVARVRRAMARRGVIESKRIYPAKKLPNGMRTSQGTTVKRIRWEVLGRKNPITRPEKRDGKALHARIEAATADYTPRRRAAIPPELARMLAGIGDAPSAPKRERSASDNSFSRGLGRATEPPEEAKRRLEAWAREHEKRGPP